MTSPVRDTIPAGRCDNCPHFAPIGEIRTCSRCPCERHTSTPAASPYRGHDPQTPPGAESALQSIADAIEAAQRDLATAIDEEVDAELARDNARDDRLLSDECPPVRRDGWTVAARDAWVRSGIRDEERAFRIAKRKRMAAQEFLNALGKKLSAQQSISRSVGQAYSASGRDGW